MASKPLTAEAIAIAEKKINMSLDDIIKMSKSKANTAIPTQQRFSNKSQRIFRGNQDKNQKMRQYLNSRSTVRQVVLAQKRSGFVGNSFPLAPEAARKAAVAPFRGRAFNHNRHANWSKPRPSGPLKQQENLPSRVYDLKAPKSGEALPKSKPKTLDSLFANMKEQRMRCLSSTNKAGVRRDGGVRRISSQVMNPWLRHRISNYRN